MRAEKYDQEFKHMRALRWAKRILLLNGLGGRCIICGEENFLVLDFHHKNRELKKQCVTRLLSHSIKNVKDEVDKCAVLCKNCHSELHYGDATGNEYKRNMLEYKKTHCCSECGYNKSYAALDFHHVVMEDKLFRLSEKSYSVRTKEIKKTEIEKELDKCVVLCKNCHFKRHQEMSFSDIREMVEEKIQRHKSNSSPMAKNKKHEMSVKNSNYRKKLATIMIVWRRSKSIVKTSEILQIDANTISENLKSSKTYQKYRARVSQKTSQYQGVSLIKESGKWLACIKINKRTKNLGTYNSEQEAYSAYCSAKTKEKDIL